jgi:hypothetical protein
MSTVSLPGEAFDYCPYAKSYRALLERLSVAAQAEDHDEVWRINYECTRLIEAMVAAVKEARAEQQEHAECERR